jgi:hypothetical protein
VTGDRRRIATFDGARLAHAMKVTPAMRHTKKKLGLKTETLRNLADSELDKIAGGIWTEATSCLPTQFNTCHPKTPNCPI